MNILKVKAVAFIDANIDDVQTVMDDADHQPEWVPHLEETRILQLFSESEALLYSRFHAPWPAHDRDFVYRSKRIRDASGRLIYRLHSQESILMREQEGYVRGLLMEGVYMLAPLEKYRTRVEFTFHANPRGWLPLWIVNVVQKHFPHEALDGLKKQLKQRGKIHKTV